MNAGSLDHVYLPLKLCYGLVPIVAGADKFMNLLTDWSAYLPEGVAKLLPISPQAFMMAVGVIEIVAGLIVLSKLTRLGSYIVAAWLLSIAGVLIVGGQYDIAVRDLVMALGAYTLGSVAALRGETLLPATTTHTSGGLRSAGT
jgi:uncharacterized membrane protein YphA (DoxX/SURF4 family)